MRTEADDYRYWMEREPSRMNSFVFVYGTLKWGKGNHLNYLGKSVFIGKARTKEKFMLFGYGIPLARLPNDSDNHWFAGQIEGELYDVSKETLGRLDSLEGHPNFYKRTITKLDEYPDHSVWMYHWAEGGGSIKGGSITPQGKDRTHDW